MKTELNELYSEISKVIQKERYTWIYNLMKDKYVKVNDLAKATGLTRQRLNQIYNEMKDEKN